MRIKTALPVSSSQFASNSSIEFVTLVAYAIDAVGKEPALWQLSLRTSQHSLTRGHP